MILVSKTLRDLRSEIVYLSTNCNHRDYPTEFQTYDEAWESLTRSLQHLRNKLGEERYTKLVDMAAQAKTHYEAEEIKWGSRLMQDMEQIVKGKPPFAYPEDMYRWSRLKAENEN